MKGSKPCPKLRRLPESNRDAYRVSKPDSQTLACMLLAATPRCTTQNGTALILSADGRGR